MAQLDDVMTALRNANQAHDTVAAQRLAQIANQLANGDGEEGAASPVAGTQPSQSRFAAGAHEFNVQHPEADQSKQPNKDAMQQGKAIVASTAAGGLMGAAAPYALMAGGAGVSLIPGGEPAGAWLMAAGESMRAARTAEIAYGALSGLSSESAGQLAESNGAGPAQAEAVRLAAGAIGPAGIAHLLPYIGKAGRVASQLVDRMANGAVTKETVPAGTAIAKAVLKSKELGGQPEHLLMNSLLEGMNHIQAASDMAARNTIQQAKALAEKTAVPGSRAYTMILAQGEKAAKAIAEGADARRQVLVKATDGKVATAAGVLKMADRELMGIGVPAEMSDIGKSLVQKASKETQAAIAAKDEAYTATKQIRDQAVAAQEKAGKFPEDMRATKDLKQELSRKLLLPAGRGQAKGQEVVESGMKAAYGRVYKALTARSFDTGLVDQSGQPIVQNFKTTFEALDHVRMKLGDVAYGNDRAEEGYKALGQHTARDLYAKISQIQKDYAGPAQEELQNDYHDAMAGLKKTKVGIGKALLNEINPKDPASFPGMAFKSATSVRDLKYLVEDDKIVETAARSYTARSIQGMTSKAVKAWAEKHSDWMREVQGLQGLVQGYAGKLEQIERVSGKIGQRIAGMAKEKEAVGKTGGSLQEKIMFEARQSAAESIKKARGVSNRRIVTTVGGGAGQVGAAAAGGGDADDSDGGVDDSGGQ